MFLNRTCMIVNEQTSASVFSNSSVCSPASGVH